MSEAISDSHCQLTPIAGLLFLGRGRVGARRQADHRSNAGQGDGLRLARGSCSTSRSVLLNPSWATKRHPLRPGLRTSPRSCGVLRRNLGRVCDEMAEIDRYGRRHVDVAGSWFVHPRLSVRRRVCGSASLLRQADGTPVNTTSPGSITHMPTLHRPDPVLEDGCPWASGDGRTRCGRRHPVVRRRIRRYCW